MLEEALHTSIFFRITKLVSSKANFQENKYVYSTLSKKEHYFRKQSIFWALAQNLL